MFWFIIGVISQVDFSVKLRQLVYYTILYTNNFVSYIAFFVTGMKSLAFLEPHDWTNVGMNLAQKDVVIIPWSMSVQTSLQNVMESCPPNL